MTILFILGFLGWTLYLILNKKSDLTWISAIPPFLFGCFIAATAFGPSIRASAIAVVVAIGRAFVAAGTG